MFSRITLINIVLAGLLIFFGIKFINIWSEEMNSVLETPITEKPKDKPKKKAAKAGMPLESSYEVVAEKNLFSSERAELKQEEKPEQRAQNPRQVRAYADKLVLYGVVVMEDYKKALVHNPKSVKGKRKARWVEEGDRIGHLTVISIERDRVLFKGGDKEYTMFLYDKGKPKKRTSVSSTPVSKKKRKRSSRYKNLSKKKAVSKDRPKIPSNPFEKITNSLRRRENNK